MCWELEGDAASVANSVLDASGQLDMNAIAGGEIPAGLGDTDHRPARLEFLAGYAIVAVALDIHSRFSRFGQIVKPDFAAAPFRVGVSHGVSSLLESTGADRMRSGQRMGVSSTDSRDGNENSAREISARNQHHDREIGVHPGKQEAGNRWPEKPAQVPAG